MSVEGSLNITEAQQGIYRYECQTHTDIYDNRTCVILVFQPTNQRSGLSATGGKILLNF